MRLNCTSKIVLLLMALAQFAGAQEVVRHPDSSQSLNQRWDWAVKQSGQSQFKNGYWIGYSIKRMMEENSTIGSMHIENGEIFRDGKSLSELIYGVELPLNDRTSAKEKSHRKVVKDVGLFFLFDPRDGALAEVKESTFELSVDFDDFPLLWLGRASDEQSFDLLERLFQPVTSTKIKEALIGAVGLHGPSTRRRILLAGVLSGNEATTVRKQAAFWLGQADDPEALKILRQAAKADRSTEVRKQTVFAMSQMDLPEAEDALFELARAQDDREVCKDAIFWLAQRGSERTAAFLKEIIYKGTDSEIQKHTVFALSQMKFSEAEDVLIELARNQNDRQICKEALFWLAQKASKRAVDLLKETVQNDADTEIQKQAIFAMTQLPDGEGIPVLIEIAQMHKNPAVRKDAIFWLGQSEDSRATDALVQLVRGK
jgi:hypothetical protein